MKIKNKIIILTSLFMSSIISANNIGKVNETSGDIEGLKNNIINQIRDSLGNYYASEVTVQVQEEENNTEWVIISEPYNCTSWIDIGGGQEQRTCDILEAKINKTKESIDSNILENLDVSWEERITQRVFIRGASVVTPPPVTPPPTIPDYEAGVRAFLTTPATGGLGSPINISWDSENAIECLVTQQSGRNFSGNGTVTFLSLGNHNVVATCTDGVETNSVSRVINVINSPITVNISAPSNTLLGNTFSYSWSSTGVSNCIVSINGSNVSTSAVSGTRNHTAINTSPINIGLTCTDGTDTESTSRTVNVGWQPPPLQANGMRHCYYNNTSVVTTVPRYIVGSSGNISIHTNSSVERLGHGSSNSQYWSNALNINFSNSGAYQWGWNSNHRCWTNGFSPSDSRYSESFYRYNNRLGCVNGVLYLLEVVATCPANQYLNRYWSGARVLRDLNNP